MSGLLLFLHKVGLALHLEAAFEVPPQDAAAHVSAAMAAASDADSEHITPELLLAMAYIESRFDPRWVSRVDRGKRVSTRVDSENPPKRVAPGISLFCGVMQTRARTWDECLELRDDLEASYAASVDNLMGWLEDRRVGGELSRALAGYGCGNRGVRTGKCNRYPGRVLWQARKLKKAGELTGQARS